MKYIKYVIFTLLLCSYACAQNYWGSSASTNPVGLTNIEIIEAAEDSIPSYTFMSSGYQDESAFSGMIESVNGATLTLVDLVIDTDENSYSENELTSEPHLLFIRDGQEIYNGMVFPIISNNGNDIVVNVNPDDTSTYFQVNDSVDIIKAITLETLFGAGDDFHGQKGTPSFADNVLVWSSFGWKTYFHNQGKWQTFGTRSSQNSTIIYPDEGLIYVRKQTSPLTLTFSGNAPTVCQSYMPSAGNKFLSSNPFPQTIKLSELIDTSSNWSKSQNISECDLILYWSGNSWIPYYHDVNNWINSVSGEIEDREILAGESFFISKNVVSSGGSFFKIQSPE